MIGVPRYVCQVCGAEGRGGGSWLLLVPDVNHGTMSVARWNHVLAQRPDVFHVCSAAHAREIVSEYTLTGHLPVKTVVESFDIHETLVSDAYPWMLRRDEQQLEELADAIEDLLEEEYATAMESGRPLQFDA
ncbi:MAG: hypothetical protein JOY79_09385 [Acidobacteriaceae bacterium]|nr:hypothetical protein [Acidobacteriaceae bacterium]